MIRPDSAVKKQTKAKPWYELRPLSKDNNNNNIIIIIIIIINHYHHIIIIIIIIVLRIIIVCRCSCINFDMNLRPYS